MSEKKDEIKDFLLSEFKESKYYKRKQEEFKLNKLMGNIRKKAKGPNPLSVKKKDSYYIQKEKDKEYKKMMAINNEGINLNEDDEKEENETIKDYNKKLEFNNINNKNIIFIKKKRKRKHKK